MPLPLLSGRKSTFRTAQLALGLLAGVAEAEPTLSLQPGTARPGDPVLVTVRGLSVEPTGSLDGRPLRFFKVGDGFQARPGGGAGHAGEHLVGDADTGHEVLDGITAASGGHQVGDLLLECGVGRVVRGAERRLHECETFDANLGDSSV